MLEYDKHYLNYLASPLYCLWVDLFFICLSVLTAYGWDYQVFFALLSFLSCKHISCYWVKIYVSKLLLFDHDSSRLQIDKSENFVEKLNLYFGAYEYVWMFEHVHEI